MLLTAGAMIAFAANSLLCRLALAPPLIDAASFASLRMVSAAVLLVCLTGTRRLRGRPDWIAVAVLSVYLLTFTFAYTELDAGFGALLLFGAAQLTMFAAGLLAGERLSPLGWAGLAVAVGAFAYLLAPGLTPPPFRASVSMTVAGITWGLYSLCGRSPADPLATTARILVVVALLAALTNGMLWSRAYVTSQGALLAVASGTVATGLGYVIWYAALPRLAAVHAATVQLSIPIIAALGGVLLLGERLTLELALAGGAVLGGIALVGRQLSPAAAERKPEIAYGAAEGETRPH